MAALRARYDAAQTTRENQNHWSNADLLSADAANSYDVRKTLRSRARYECHESNCYAAGMVQTLAEETIGSGPRVQLSTNNRELNRRIEFEFSQWAKRIKLAEKLRTMRKAKAVDGESFAVIRNNGGLDHPIKLDLELIEADRVTTPDLDVLDENTIDGIKFDRWGNPESYTILREHPGDVGFGLKAPTLKYDTIAAEFVIHLFRTDRPGQRRGVPEVTPSLPLFAQLRRYTLAVISAAETAAEFAAVLKSQGAAHEDADEIEALDAIDIERNMMVTLPYGYEMQQFRPEQPTQTYGDFKREILNEAARPLSMPYNIAAANSSGYNYSSGRLDFQSWNIALTIERRFFEIEVLERLFVAWLDEAALLGLLPPPEQFDAMRISWFWDGRGHVDPSKESKASETGLKIGTTHRAREYAKEGLDVEIEDEIAAQSFGVSVDDYRSAVFQATFASPSETGGENSSNEDKEVEEDGDENDESRDESQKTAGAKG